MVVVPVVIGCNAEDGWPIVGTSTHKVSPGLDGIINPRMAVEFEPRPVFVLLRAAVLHPVFVLIERMKAGVESPPIVEVKAAM